MKNRNSITICTTILLACFGFLPGAQPVVPAPDGGYPGGNTAEGQNALLNLTTGVHNTAVGFLSLKSNITGGYNTALGSGTLFANTADGNTAAGTFALLRNTTGSTNTAVGVTALLSNTEGSQNTANGAYALSSNTTGSGNTANGYQALLNNTTADTNTATGRNALNVNTTGGSNTANGVGALFNNSTGSRNTALGAFAGQGISTAHNVIAIGAAGANVSNSCFIGHIHGETIDPATALIVAVDAAGKLGTSTSSRRFKHDIKPMDKSSEAILALKPVTFHYTSDTRGTPQFGLIAEEVAEVNPDLVVRDKNGDIYTVRYDAVNAMLLNEFLKEYRKNEEQKATIAQLKSTVEKQEATNTQQQKQIEALTAGLQKVSAQVEMGRPAPRVVVKNQ